MADREGMVPSVMGAGAADPLGPGQMVGEFEIGKLLAAGGMGIVYSAIHPVIGKRAAIKVLHPRLGDHDESIERFLTEARAVNRIGHPNIVDVFAFGTLSDGRSYMVMEWLPGESLAQRLVRGPLAVDEALAVLDQTADALEAAHEKGIVHRDLKPDNIFLVPVRGNRTLVKLLDFGIAKLVESPEGKSMQSTRPGSIMGTPGYLSPEQARGLAVDGRTDVYALGCVAFEMLSGRTPFDCDNMADMIVAHLESPPPHIRELVPAVSATLDAMIVRMLDKVQAVRPTLVEVRSVCRTPTLVPTTPTGVTSASLDGAVRSIAPVVPKPTPFPSGMIEVRPATSRRPVFLAGAVAAVTLAIGLAVIFGSARDGRKDPERTSVVEDYLAPARVAASAPAPAPAPAPPPPAPTQGGLVITVAPAAQISVDGKVVASDAAHHELAIDAGTHEVVLAATGRTPVTKMVRVNAGAQTELSVDLPRAPVVARPAAAATAPPVKVKKAKPGSDDYVLDPFKTE